MVKFLQSSKGQGVTEYVVMLAILTLMGVWILNGVGGPGTGLTNLAGQGKISSMSQKSTTAIATDERP